MKPSGRSPNQTVNPVGLVAGTLSSVAVAVNRTSGYRASLVLILSIALMPEGSGNGSHTIRIGAWLPNGPRISCGDF
ncbi:MAG TPA: hypothetical protein VFH67_04385, partial [bacterium]|nr:hypothetical protein [bacterium]